MHIEIIHLELIQNFPKNSCFFYQEARGGEGGAGNSAYELNR